MLSDTCLSFDQFALFLPIFFTRTAKTARARCLARFAAVFRPPYRGGHGSLHPNDRLFGRLCGYYLNSITVLLRSDCNSVPYAGRPVCLP